MKKIMVALLMVALIGGVAFAQGKVTVSVDLLTDVFYSRTTTGDEAEKAGKDGSVYNGKTGDSTVTGKITDDYKPGYLGFFSSNAFDANEGSIKFQYTDDFAGATLQLRADGPDKANPVKINDYEAWLKIGPVKVLGGNTAQRGAVGRYQNFDDFLQIKFDNYGIILPKADGAGDDKAGAAAQKTAFLGTDSNNLLKNSKDYTAKGFIAEASFAPITVSASIGNVFAKAEKASDSLLTSGTSGWTIENDDGSIDYVNPTTYTGSKVPVWGKKTGRLIVGEETTSNFGIRVEGAKIADLVTVAVTFKNINGEFKADNAAWKKYLGQAANASGYDGDVYEKLNISDLGVYADITPIDGLGIGFGYTAQFSTSSAKYGTSASEVKAENPFWNGIDLRVNYSGIENLGITFNNNVSFSTVKGKNVSDGKTVVNEFGTGVDLDSPNGGKGSASWFALYNALGAKYALSDAITIDAQFSNALGVADSKYDGKQYVKYTTDIFAAYAGLTYTVVPGATLRGGLAAKSTSYETYTGHEDLLGTNKTYKTGKFEIGIPLGLKVEW
jgi:hypothetical protein